MLNAQANDRMCRVGADQPMGRALRRYWLPVLPSSELESGSDPKGVDHLGERLVVWRDDAGRVGVYSEACLHRGASMLLARVEGDGLRCIYHGWKFATDGAVLDTPNVADPKFKERIRGRVYPTREAGGLIWAWLGAGGKEQVPEFPRWPWMELPEANRLVTRHVEECNFVQVIEGLVDSSHLNVLHMNGLKQSGSVDIAFANKVNAMQRNLVPRFELADTEFGFYYAALRDVADAQGARTDVRIAAFVAPCIVLNPNGDIATYVVPMADERTAFFHVFWSETEQLNREPLRSRHLEFIGLAPKVLAEFGLTDATMGQPGLPNARNNFLQDRAAMRRGESWSGMPGLIEEDVAASVSAGPLRDRTTEVLSVADVGVSRLYRTLLACADAAERGEPPLAVGRAIDWSAVVGTHGVLDERGWQALLPQRAEVEA
jgi:nitrite reductase/ring-hydroxylating ferredoxin subunit